MMMHVMVAAKHDASAYFGGDSAVNAAGWAAAAAGNAFTYCCLVSVNGNTPLVMMFADVRVNVKVPTMSLPLKAAAIS